MCSSLGMMTLVLWIDQITLLPRHIVYTAQACQILVAIGIFAIVELKNARPVGQKEQVRQTGAMHANEYVRVPSDGQLLSEGETAMNSKKLATIESS